MPRNNKTKFKQCSNHDLKELAKELSQILRLVKHLTAIPSKKKEISFLKERNEYFLEHSPI
ncbi:hypothetical protein BY996DRAFT_6581782 [Phakopsora pachyrhizi]|nr:hypothetical protein BY996DRAFT_6581782 [Phakopsora pachyrhizi]